MFLCHAKGTTMRGYFFQMYLLEGLTRWNEDRAQEAEGGSVTGMKGYSSREHHTFCQLTQHFYGGTLAESYTKPPEYTGNKNRK